MHLPVHLGVLGVAGVDMGEQGRDDRLVVGPPELHEVPVFLDGLALEVREVEQAAVLAVPPALPHPVEHAQRGRGVVLVAGAAGLAQDEPGGLDGVAGIEQAAVEMVGIDLPLGADHLHDGPQLGLHEVAEDLGDGDVGPLREGLAADHRVAEAGAHVLGGHEGHHEGREAAGGPEALGRDVAGLAVELEEGVVGGEGAVLPLGLAGGAEGLGMADGGEALGEDVAAHAQGLALAGNGEVELARGGAALVAQEADAGEVGLQPLGAALDGVVQHPEGPRGAALEPDGLVGVDQLAAPAEGGEHAAVLAVETVAEPERQDVAKKPVAVLAEQLGLAGGDIGCHARKLASRGGAVNGQAGLPAAGTPPWWVHAPAPPAPGFREPRLVRRRALAACRVPDDRGLGARPCPPTRPARPAAPGGRGHGQGGGANGTAHGRARARRQPIRRCARPRGPRLPDRLRGGLCRAFPPSPLLGGAGQPRVLGVGPWAAALRGGEARLRTLDPAGPVLVARGRPRGRRQGQVRLPRHLGLHPKVP